MTDTRPGTETEIASSVDADVFAQRYLVHAVRQLPGRDSSTLTTLARDNLAFGGVRTAGQILLRVRDIDADTTAIAVVTGDAPYLVDSVRGRARTLRKSRRADPAPATGRSAR